MSIGKYCRFGGVSFVCADDLAVEEVMKYWDSLKYVIVDKSLFLRIISSSSALPKEASSFAWLEAMESKWLQAVKLLKKCKGCIRDIKLRA